MNLYLTFILFVLIVSYLLDTTADILNLSCLRKSLPEEFKDIYDAQKYNHYLNYQTENARFDIMHRSFSFALILFFIFYGGFNFVDQLARSLNLNSIWTGLVFAAILSVLKFITQLPFSLYSTFVIEEKYGFNKTTFKTFLSDLVKGALIGSILGGLIFAGIIYFFETAGPLAWVYSWLGVTLFQLILVYLAPAFIMPLFNRFEPLAEGPLRKAIEAFAKTRHFRLQGIFTMDNSKRSTKSNAFFTGFGRFRRLVLFDTLIEKHSTEELVAILAHEIGHFERKHIIKSMLLSIFYSAIVFYTFGLFMNNKQLFEAFRMSQTSVYASLIFIGFLYSPILRILSIFTQKLSRKYEFEADAFALKTYGHPETLISALKKLSMDNLAHLTPHPLKVILDYTHPPILQRIEALRRTL